MTAAGRPRTVSNVYPVVQLDLGESRIRPDPRIGVTPKTTGFDRSPERTV
jgi:hypothetical protein